MDRTDTHTQYQRSNSEQVEVNAKLFNVIRKRKISTQERVKKIKKLLGKKPQPDINAQDGNDNQNTALHLAIERNELEVVSFLLSEGANTTIGNGDGKTSLQLAEECNHADITEVLKRFTSPVECPLSETGRLASHNSQPVAANPIDVSVFHSNSHVAETDKQTASTVLPLFSGKLSIDKELIWSEENFKKSIESFFGKGKLSAIDQLKATPPYPTTHVLAQFANMAYRDCKHGDPNIPASWHLLTTGTNFWNGYFGTAYWNPEYQQVVIAHRGTETENITAFLKDLLADIKGVVCNKYIDQMNSASTFANKVVAVLQEIEQEVKVSFELFFTGHSLGGWLAQITAFTTEYLYLEEKKGKFLKKHRTEHELPASITVQDCHDVRESYHPHTLVFDSPGCEKMMLKMKDTFDVRNKGSSIYVQHLDITSYLSAPNRINTCNKHLGTVYHICTGLCCMGYHKKNIQNSLSYNKATHSMDKIVEVLDPETRKKNDDKLEPKILEVVDWPVSKGLMGGAEYNDVFKGAEILLHFQTKDYDECTKSLSIFTQDEQEFLQLYCWLQNLPDLFKPEDLFSELNNAEAETEAERMLRDFKLDDEKIRCPDASTLDCLIPFVKRLVRLFPQLKDKAKDQLSSLQIRKRVYQYETQCCVEKICQSTLDFNPEALSLTEFLDSKQQIWHIRMIDTDAWTGITKVYRVLQNTSCTPNYSSEGHYTTLELERLLMVNRMVNLNALLQSEMDKPLLLIIACRNSQTVNDELEKIFEELFSILKQKNNMKIILTMQSEDSTSAFLQQIASKALGEGMKTTDEKVTWSELTDSSRRKMFEKKAIFQGLSVALNEISSPESMTKFFPLADLLHEKELRIGVEPVPSASSGYNEKFYIDRTFKHNIIIRQDIAIDNREGKFADLLASTEQEFKQLCEQNPTSKVHWLVKDKSGELLWQQSKGNLSKIRKYIDAHKSHCYAPSDSDKLLQEAKKQRVMLIADKGGMGKTTILTHLSKQIRQKYPAHWLVRINLTDNTELLKAQKGKTIDKEWVLEFVSKEVLKLESHLEKELFKKSFEGNGINKVVVMVDGFDEISPCCKETVLDMLQILKQTSLEQLWVTTRPHLKEDLEDNLQQLSYTLQPFSEDEQVQFLKEFWTKSLNIEVTNQNLLQIYAKSLIRKLAQSSRDKDKEFIGIPLQTRMLAEAFKEEFRSFYHSEKSDPELQHNLDLMGLYRLFIDRKYDIYYEKKSKIQEGNMGADEIRKRDSENIQLQHQLLALDALFTEDQVTFPLISTSDEDLARIRIVQRNIEGKLQFIHRTFAEFYVAEFLIKQLTKKTKQHTQVLDILLNKVLLQTGCEVTRSFFNGLLEKFQPSNEVLKECGKKLDEMWNEREEHRPLTGVTTALHKAAAEDNACIIGFLLESLKFAEHSDATKKMLLAKDDLGQTVLHIAADTKSVKVLKEIWEWVEIAHLNPNELKNEFLLTQDTNGYTAWHRAAILGSLLALETLWIWAKEAELNLHELLLDKSEQGRTSLQLAAERNQVGILEKVWVWAEETQVNPNNLKKILFLAKDNKGFTAWHIAALLGSLEVLETLWIWAMGLELKPDELLLAQVEGGATAFHLATYGNHVGILQKLCVWAEKAQQNPNELKKTLLLAKDNRGHTAWHTAALFGRLWALETLCSLATEVELKPDELLFAQNEEGYTALHFAACGNHVGILEKLWVWVEEAQQNPNELKKKLLLAKDNRGFTVWHRAAFNGRLGALETLCSLATEVELKPDEFLLAEGKEAFTALHLAAYGNHVGILEKLWVWVEEAQQNPNELKKKLLLAKDKKGFTAWHDAANNGSLEALELFCSWAKEVELKPDELLLAQSGVRYTALHMAALGNHVGILEKLWVWVEEAQQNPSELKKKLLLEKDNEGLTAWHCAANKGSLEVLELICSWAKEVEIKPDELLLAQIEKGTTAFHMAAHRNHVEVLKKIWDCAEEAQLHPNELNKKLFLAKDNYGLTAWHRAALLGSLEALETLFSWAMELELKADELLLAQVEEGATAFHLATYGKHVGILQKLWVWAEEAQENPNDLKKKLLLAKDNKGLTAWHDAANNGSLEVLETLCSWAMELEIKPDEFLLTQVERGLTALHIATYGNHVGILQKLWVWAEETQENPNDLKKKLLLVNDNEGLTAWHLAALNGRLESSKTLLRFAKKAELNPDELLLAQIEKGATAFHMAAHRNHVEVLKQIWDWVEEAQLNPNELKKKLFLAKDNDELTAWHRAALLGSLEALETLCSWAMELELKPDELLLAQVEGGVTAFHLATYGNHVGILQKLWVWAEEAQANPSDLKKKLFLAKDIDGFTAWHSAAVSGKLGALETLCSFATEVELKPDELLLAHVEEGFTALHLAAYGNDVGILQKLWVWAEEAQENPNDLKKKLFLAKGNCGFTAWHLAARNGSLEALVTLKLFAIEAELNTDEL